MNGQGNGWEIRQSPNGVDHLVRVAGNCATCGMGPHKDWPARPYEPGPIVRALLSHH